MSVKEREGNVIVTQYARQAKDIASVNVFTVSKEMDGTVKVYVKKTDASFRIPDSLVSFNTIAPLQI